MKQLISVPSYRTRALCALAGIGAGFLNGLLGAGGGIVLVLVFSVLMPSEEESAVKDRFAAAITVMFPVALLSTFLYFRNGHVDNTVLPVMLLPAVAGGAAGALFMDRIRAGFLRKLFAVVVIIAGINMLV